MNVAIAGVGGAIALFCTIWVIYEVWAVNKNLTTGYKVIWTLGAFFFSILSAILYYFMVKRESVA